MSAGIHVAGLDRVGAAQVRHWAELAPARLLVIEAVQLEHRLSDLVNEAYGLTPGEVELMWQTAPPRMPISKLV